ncbi:MAG: hypothetical protein IT458_06960, partial [Planctomycetes bacterium]|nr:hypothetical protein [Planctomycetota bacterium]
GANNPVFVGWGGVLLPDGSAAPRLVVPNVSLQPFTMHIQAATIDPLRLTGIRSLANLHVLRL